VLCQDGARDYRVVQQAPSEPGCIGPIDSVFFTTDGVVLCAVQDFN
jgi:hypothetical protein